MVKQMRMFGYLKELYKGNNKDANKIVIHNMEKHGIMVYLYTRDNWKSAMMVSGRSIL